MADQPLDLGTLRSELEGAGSPWRMSYTSITALTEEERVIRLGVPVDPGTAEQLDLGRDAAASAAAEAITAATSFDLRNVGGTNYGTPIRDQGQCGSCVAFGVAATLEGTARYTRRTPALPMDLSEAQIFYC